MITPKSFRARLRLYGLEPQEHPTQRVILAILDDQPDVETFIEDWYKAMLQLRRQQPPLPTTRTP